MDVKYKLQHRMISMMAIVSSGYRSRFTSYHIGSGYNYGILMVDSEKNAINSNATKARSLLGGS